MHSSNSSLASVGRKSTFIVIPYSVSLSEFMGFETKDFSPLTHDKFAIAERSRIQASSSLSFSGDLQ